MKRIRCKKICIFHIATLLAIISLGIAIIYLNLKREEFPPKPPYGYEEVTYEEVKGFCGSSTYGRCNFDTDCIRGGCSGQICQSIYEEGIITTCEWRECYDSRKYGVECRCINKTCRWI